MNGQRIEENIYLKFIFSFIFKIIFTFAHQKENILNVIEIIFKLKSINSIKSKLENT